MPVYYLYKNTIPHLMWLMLVLNSFNALSQETPKLQTLKGYLQELSRYTDFPSSCIGNIFEDNEGRLWITKCGSAHEVSSELFTFDGYGYASISPQPKIESHHFEYVDLVDHKLFYNFMTPDALVFSYYDITGNSRTTYDSIGMHGAIKNNHKFVKQTVVDSSLYTYSYLNDSLRLTVFDKHLNKKKYKPVSIRKIFGKETYLPKLQINSIAYYKEWVILYNHLHDTFRVANLKNAQVQTIDNTLTDKPDLLIDKEIFNLGSSVIFKLVFDGEVQTITLGIDDRAETEPIFRLKEANTHKRDKDFINFFNTLQYFVDKHGNIITSYEEKDKLYVELQTNHGEVYDLSYITESFEYNTIKIIKGDNFLDQFYISTERDFYLFKASSASFIQSYPTGLSARSIVQLPTGEIVYKNQDTQTLFGIIHENDNSNAVALDECGFQELSIDRSETAVWGIKNSNLVRYDIATQNCEFIELEPFIKQLKYVHHDKLILLDASNGYWSFTPSTNSLQPLLSEGEQLKVISDFQDFIVDKDGIMWIVCHNGLLRYNFTSGELINMKSLAKDFDFNFTSIALSGEDAFLLGSFYSGVVHFNKTNYNYTVIDESKGLCDNTVASVTLDTDGNFWVGTYNGVAVIDSRLNIIGSLYESDGLVNSESNRLSSARLNDGRIAIGTMKGISIIQPKETINYLQSLNPPKIYFTNLNYFDKSKNEFVKANYNKALDLAASDNRFNLEFALSSYVFPTHNTYAYKIEGQDDQWINLDNNKLSFNNLSPGTYTLLIKGYDYHNMESSNQLKLQVSVGAFFYEQLWFYLLMFMLLLSVTLAWVYTLKTKINTATKKIARDKSLIEKQALKLKKLNTAKDVFFTNITHEFRTPLSIITSTVHLLKDYNTLSIDKELNTIENSAKNLLQKINQILNLRQLESGKLKIHNIQSDMIRYVSAIVDAHSYVAKDKAIELQLIKDKDTLLMDFDPEKIEIIVSNILSNAIKYTPPNGWIEVKLATENEDNTFVITIKDNGVGISEEEKQHVFDYFYRSESVLNMANSSGIGLTLTKKLIDIIHGQIEITSMVGAGTEVSIYIPITQQASYTEVDSLALNTTTEVYKEEGTFSTEKTERYKQYSILIVEDNDTLRELLKAQLGNYSIYAAEDGEKGEALALEILPDIIISDVMMPKKNGYELCKTLKAHPATSHIPIVLLTAKADQKSKLQGLETQADAYLYKPYDIKELELTLRNFIESRKKLYKRYRHLEKSLNDRPVDNREDKFIIELRTIIKANITDVDYGYKSLHEALNISKAQLYKKLKSLTGLSVGNYILLIRLQEAKKLLTETDLSIKEVTFSVGLTSQSYLSKKFKEEFNMTPSEWREGKVKGKTF